MILSNVNKFHDYIPMALDIDIDIIKPHLEEMDVFLIANFFGNDLYELICSLDDDEPFRKICEKYLCHAALYEAIPSLDLVLTNNGFGVVGGSGSQMLPASRDRVAALRLQEDVWREKYQSLIIQRIITKVEYLTAWQASGMNVKFSSNLFTGYDDFKTFVPGGELQDPEKYRIGLAACRKLLPTYVYPFLSGEYTTHLIKSQYGSNVISENDQTILNLVKDAMGSLLHIPRPVKTDYEKVESILVAAVNYMESFIDDFPIYKDSETYQVKHMERYQNEKDHPTFFGAI